MAKKSDKQDKAVKKIKKVVLKAVDKGVSAEVVSATVEDALGAIADVETGDSDDAAPPATKAARMPSGNKQTDVTLKRVVTATSAVLNKKPLKPDSEKLKKLPGKRKPPTLTLKRGRNS